MSDTFDDLKKLSEMLERGEVTQVEYDRIKADLLAEQTATQEAPDHPMLGKPEGWYPDPTGEKTDYLAYWNGQEWTGETKPIQKAGEIKGGMTDQTRYFLIGAGVLMAIGSFMPWGQAGIFTVSGTQGDGVITLIAGVVIAIIGIAKRASALSGILVILLAGGSGLIVLNVIANFTDTPESMGTGLFVVGGAALFALIAGVKTLRERPRA